MSQWKYFASDLIEQKYEERIFNPALDNTETFQNGPWGTNYTYGPGQKYSAFWGKFFLYTKENIASSGFHKQAMLLDRK